MKNCKCSKSSQGKGILSPYHASPETNPAHFAHLWANLFTHNHHQQYEWSTLMLGVTMCCMGKGNY